MHKRISTILENKSFDLFKNSLVVTFFISLFIPNLYAYIINQIISYEIVNLPDFIVSRSLSFIIQCLLIILYIFENIFKRKKFSFSFNIKWILLILFYSIFINIFYFGSLGYLLTINYFYAYLINVLFMILLVENIKDNDRLFRYITSLIIVSTTILSISLITDIFTITNLQSKRVSLIGWKENDLSFVLSVGYAILTSYIVDNKFQSKIKPIILISSSIIIIDAILLTGTRASIFVISFILTIIFLSLLKNPINQKIKIILLISNIIFYVSKTTTYKPITDRFFVDNFTTFGGRIFHWLFTLRVANQNPVFGLGVEKYRSMVFDFFNGRRYGMPENLFIELFVTAGIFALALLLLLITYNYILGFYIYLRTKKLELLIWQTPLVASILVLNIRHYKIFFAFLALYLIREITYKDNLNINNNKLFYISRFK
tara:strand:+ start:2520 stop:3812 length:1293 start_codon:yes stop_codon:yes gene_type:complete